MLKLLLSECAIALAAIAAIAVGYAWLLPHFFHGEKTDSVLIGGVILAAIVAGVVAKVLVSAVGARGWVVSMLWGVGVGGAVLFGALAVIVILLGS